MSLTQSDIDFARDTVARMRNNPEVSASLARVIDYIRPTFREPSSDMTLTVVKKRRGHELHLRLPDPEQRALESLLRDGETPCVAIRRLIAVEYLRQAGIEI